MLINPPFLLKLAVLVIFTQFSIQPLTLAQNLDYLEDEGESLWEEQQFLDVTGEEFTTEDAQYVGEEEVKEAREAAERAGLPSVDLAAALARDQEMLPDNIMYGIGTGALIGGWFALVEGGDSRENVRFLTVGTLAGALLGVAIGNKALFLSQAPTADSSMGIASNETNATPDETEKIQPSFQITPKMAKFNLKISF
ncbi:MAG: hypothetical protein MJE63_23950 [Proteobacteria bacterium]|nr:hypothetical protein [Pseudomonadota bacterium]